MSEINFTQEIISDIISTEDYSIAGVANHTQIPEEVLIDVASGVNKNPSFDLVRKILELHMVVKRDLYIKILNKVLSEYHKKEK